MHLYATELILCHLAHSQTPLQSLSTSSTGPGHHCMLRHVLGKPGLKKHNRKYKNNLHVLQEGRYISMGGQGILLAALKQKENAAESA